MPRARVKLPGRAITSLSLGNLLALLSGLRERDGDGLFSTFHLASLAALATLCFPTLVAVHLAFDFRACSSRILTLSLLRHLALL